MAAVTLTAVPSTRAGATLTFATPDAVDGVQFDNKRKNGILLVQNTSASPVTVTINIVKTLDGMVVADRTITVAASQVKAIGPFPELYEQANGTVKVTFSVVASVGAALLTAGPLSV